LAHFIYKIGFAGFSLSKEDVPLSQIIAKGKKTSNVDIITKIDGMKLFQKAEFIFLI